MENAKLDAGVCYLKPEFTKQVLDQIKNKKEEEEEVGNDNGEPPSKRHKKEKNKGQNKNRPVFRESFDDKICRSLVDGEIGNCERGDGCRFLHDIKLYFEKKLPDLGDKCPIYSTKGYCGYGISCRFGSEHITEDFKNMNIEKRVNEERTLSHDLQVALRKKTYDFSATDAILRDTDELKQSRKAAGSCDDDENVITRPEERKKVDFRDKLVLSPLTTVGNLPFRRICKEYGADITVGEMACSMPLVTGSMSEWALTKRHSSEDVFGVQIEGNNSKTIVHAAQLLAENVDIDFIDLNIGCPIDLIFKHGGGSALIRRQNVLESVVRTCSKFLKDKPFTVKTRTGISANNLVAKELLPKLEKWGASAVTLHGRTKEQRYSKQADWNYIDECAAGMKEIPVIGNGDIFSYEDYQMIKEKYKHVSSVMIGRGALIKPWIFKEIKEGNTFDISSQERLEMIKKYVNYGLEHWGSDTRGVETTRRFLLEWLSFLYRYVPYAIVMYPPQKINQRPETDFYLGRDDLETLMKSDNSKDWIKISEMFLGKVPDGFIFLPKHKANAY